LGYSITGEVNLRRMFVVTGPTGSGKSTLLNLVTQIMEGYAVGEIPLSVVTKQNNAQHPTDLATLEGVRIGVIPELNEERYLSTAKLKLITGGGDKISARRMREDFYTFTPRVKIWFTGNEPPHIKEQGDAVLERMVVFPFRNSFAPGRTGHDPHLNEKLAQELPGILQWLIEGAYKWYRDGASVEALRIPYTLEIERDSYMQSADDMGEFFSEWINVQTDKTPTDELEWHHVGDVFTVYNQWAIREGLRHGWSKNVVTRTMVSRGSLKKRLASGNHLAMQFLQPALDALYEAQAQGINFPSRTL
jgi:putative DNA primase/helicase